MNKSDSMEFNVTHKCILTILYNAQKPLTTSDIAKRSSMSWITAKKYLQEMCADDILKSGKQGKSVFW